MFKISLYTLYNAILSAVLISFLLIIPKNISANNGYEFWLRYNVVTEQNNLEEYKTYCKEIVIAEEEEILISAQQELSLGISKMLGVEPIISNIPKLSGSIILGSAGNNKFIRKLFPSENFNFRSSEEFKILSAELNNKFYIVITGETNQAILYGAFHFLRLLQTNQSIKNLNISDTPLNKLRLVNHWDNPSGKVERGYAGRSIFHWDKLPQLEPRYKDYARMLASMGINGCVLNNVNTRKNNLTGWKLLTTEYINKIRSLAELFRSYGIQVYISVNFFSPIILDSLESADPFNSDVQKWWNNKVDEIYSNIPDFGGFLVKADSEGEPGPMKYGRSQADGANMLADALRPHGGLLIWRAFVYGHKEMDRAAQAYYTFKPDDGKFAENVIIQIKNGPIDFQVREPVSPLFGAMPQTNQMLELQITQEYTGHSTHLCYLVPQWKEILNFDTKLSTEESTIIKVISGELFNNKHNGIAGVINIGSDSNWTGHQLAQANTYGYGRIAWNPYLSEKQITDEWIKMTFGNDNEVVETISKILLDSWTTYEDYTSPLGIGMLSNKKGDINHFYPAPEEREKIHHADKYGIGYDRTVKTGSGYTNQYSDTVASVYENIETCPDELLLFFHHVPYTHRLKSGKTVIQHIYDSHYDGVEKVIAMKNEWILLKDKMDLETFDHVLGKFNKQIEQAKLWRDVINKYFYELSGIPDVKNRIL